MKFFNKYLLKYSLIDFVATSLVYFIVLVLNRNGSNQLTLFFYLSLLFVSAYRIGRRDDYKRFFGINYHLITYVIYNSIPLALTALNILPPETLDDTLQVMLLWGIFLFVHLMVLIIFWSYSYRHYRYSK
ncbi:MAG TPA: hypothetical protein VN721_04720 [Flavipsychrobacter sp.]|nr:hypothetical protein [Flavipsychrobacter sp.]